MVAHTPNPAVKGSFAIMPLAPLPPAQVLINAGHSRGGGNQFGTALSFLVVGLGCSPPLKPAS